MKYRPQRGGLSESIAEYVELPDTLQALARHLGVDIARVTVTAYGYDSRICCDTWLVCIDGQGCGWAH